MSSNLHNIVTTDSHQGLFVTKDIAHSPPDSPDSQYFRGGYRAESADKKFRNLSNAVTGTQFFFFFFLIDI